MSQRIERLKWGLKLIIKNTVIQLKIEMERIEKKSVLNVLNELSDIIIFTRC